MTIQKLKKKNPESSQLFLPTTSWAYITTSVTSDPIRASQRVFLFPLLPLLPSNFSMAATVSFKHTNQILLFSLPMASYHIYNETWMPSHVLPSLHHLLPHPASHVRLCPPCSFYGPTWAVRWLPESLLLWSLFSSKAWLGLPGSSFTSQLKWYIHREAFSSSHLKRSPAFSTLHLVAFIFIMRMIVITAQNYLFKN